MLGFLQRATLGFVSPLVCALFPPASQPATPARTRLQWSRHPRQLLERCDGQHCDFMRNSVFGLVNVYNRLPAAVVATESIKLFQRSLTDIARAACREQKLSWHAIFPPRVITA